MQREIRSVDDDRRRLAQTDASWFIILFAFTARRFYLLLSVVPVVSLIYIHFQVQVSMKENS